MRGRCLRRIAAILSPGWGTNREGCITLGGECREDGGSGTRSDADGDQAGLEVIETVRDSRGSAEEAALAQERSGEIRRAFEVLNERERLIVQTVFVEGRTAREVSHMVGVSESRISQVIREIRVKLADQLAPYDSLAA